MIFLKTFQRQQSNPDITKGRITVARSTCPRSKAASTSQLVESALCHRLHRHPEQKLGLEAAISSELNPDGGVQPQPEHSKYNLHDQLNLLPPASLLCFNCVYEPFFKDVKEGNQAVSSLRYRVPSMLTEDMLQLNRTPSGIKYWNFMCC